MRFEGNKLAIADGKQLFGQMNCTGCHFNGGGGMGPALMSGHWRYGGRIEQIYESIAQGRPNGMPSWQDSLEPTQIWDLAAYVKSLSVPAPASAVANLGHRASSHEVALAFLLRRIGGAPRDRRRCRGRRRASRLRRSQQSAVLGSGRPRFREQDRRADCAGSRLRPWTIRGGRNGAAMSGTR